MRFLLAMIGYLAVATVIAVALGVGYLWQTDLLNDDKVFRIVALVHDVDVEGAVRDQGDNPLTPGAPDEEPSLDELQNLREVALRDFEVKQSALEQGQNEFTHLLEQLGEARDRFDAMARELDERIKQESELAGKESVASVVRDLRSVKADRAKELLLRVLDDGRGGAEAERVAMDNVIRLMNAMPTNTLTNILKKFQTEEELDKLHAIHQLMLEGGPKQEALEELQRQLQNRESPGA